MVLAVLVVEKPHVLPQTAMIMIEVPQLEFIFAWLLLLLLLLRVSLEVHLPFLNFPVQHRLVSCDCMSFSLLPIVTHLGHVFIVVLLILSIFVLCVVSMFTENNVCVYKKQRGGEIIM